MFKKSLLLLTLVSASFTLCTNRAQAAGETSKDSTPSSVDSPTAVSFPESEVERLTATGLGKFSQGDFAGAVSEFSNAIKISPRRGSLYLQRGLAYLDMDSYENALDDFNKANELDKSNKIAILVCRGRALLGLQKIDAALADLNQAIKEDPKYALAFISRADAYLKAGDDEKALDDLEKALGLDPRQPRAYLLRAKYYKHRHNDDQAAKDINTAISLDASFMDSDYMELSKEEKRLRDNLARSIKFGGKREMAADLLDRGMAHERAGEYLQAIQELTSAIGDSPDSLEAYKWRATVFMNMSEFESATKDWCKAIEISPQDPNLRAMRAKAYLELGQNDKAIEDYSKAIELSGKPPASLFEARGIVYSRQGNSDEAITDFGKSIEIDPVSSTAYADRGLEYVVHKRYQDAIADFSNSITRGHDLALSYKFRGQCKQYLGDTRGAIADFEKAAQLYKDQKDLFGFRQLDKRISLLKKGGNSSAGNR